VKQGRDVAVRPEFLAVPVGIEVAVVGGLMEQFHRLGGIALGEAIAIRFRQLGVVPVNLGRRR
jgi:hypothetical protein